MSYGCAGDGVTNDTACFQNALAAAVGNELDLGPHVYLITSSLIESGPVYIKGTGTGDASYNNPSGNSDQRSGLRAGIANLNLLTIYTGSRIEGVFFDMTNQGTLTNTAGSAITIPNTAWSTVIQHNWINGPCIGISLNGNNNTVQNNSIENFTGSNCWGMIVGATTTNAGTTDDRIVNNQILAGIVGGVQTAAGGMFIQDAGGLFLHGNDIYYPIVGTLIQPGANQQVIWMAASDTVFGDTTLNQGLVIQTSSSSAKVAGLQLTSTWASTSSGNSDEISINNSGGGLVTDIYISGLRDINTSPYGGNGITIDPGVTNVSIDTSHICGVGNAAIEVKPGVSGIRIRNSDISPTCAGVTGKGSIGILLDGSNADISITGNDLTGNGTPISGTPTGTSTVANNTL